MLTQTRKIFLELNGKEIVIEDESKIRIETTITEVCDNKKCAGPHGNDGPTSYSWIQEKTQQDVYALPEGLWSFIRRQRYGAPEPQSCCSRQCEKEVIREETPILSPHEQRRIEAACAKVDARHTEPSSRQAEPEGEQTT